MKGDKMETEFEGKSHNKSKIILLIYMSMFSSSIMGLSLLIPQVLTAIVQHDHPHYTEDQIEGQASTYKSFIDGINAIVGLLALPVLGGLSDIVGRKKIMIVGCCTLLSYMVVFRLGYTYRMLSLAYAASCFSFSMANQTCAIGFMSDIARNEKDRATNFGLILAAFMMGFIGGSLVIGYIDKKYGMDVAFYCIFGLAAVALLFLILALHETSAHFKSRHERKFSIAKCNPFTSLRLILGVHPYVTTLAIVYAINFLGVSDGMTSGFLYTQHRYGWGSFQNGLASSANGVTGMIMQGLFVGILLRLTSRERILNTVMFLSIGIHFLQGYAPHAWMYFLGSVLGGVAALSYPFIQALISQRIPKEQQGIAFGGLSSISSIATFVGALFSENIFSVCLEKKFVTCPGTAFYICGCLFVINGIILLVLFSKYPPQAAELTKPIIETINSEEEGLLANQEKTLN